MKDVNSIIKIDKKEEDRLFDYYKKSLNNKEFKELIDCINLNDEVLKNYTSNLIDASKEFSNCKNCKGLNECKNKIKGYIYTPIVKDNNLDFNYNACKYLLNDLESKKHLENIYLFEVPKKVKNASLKDLYKNDKKRIEFIKYVNNFINEYKDKKYSKGIYLHGSYGTGKTYLIAALFNELAKKGIRSSIVYVPEFLRVLKQSFSENYEEIYTSIKKSPLLLLDDIGSEYLTSWSRDEILSTILQYRSDEELPTFFTSNLNLKELENHLSNTSNTVDSIKARRIMERIKDLTIDFELTGENNRK